VGSGRTITGKEMPQEVPAPVARGGAATATATFANSGTSESGEVTGRFARCCVWASNSAPSPVALPTGTGAVELPAGGLRLDPGRGRPASLIFCAPVDSQLVVHDFRHPRTIWPYHSIG